ncbi:uncharacterized protein LOC128642701 [Bombina bombina]|uniref:uncharacterized protein LOC128642701 n=1 Tax=Bombina bombina TaxID=8345 RepID=UPI00235B2CFB|nr:uncharacterized protein LOC128642701 [Bombina bombina]
MDRMGNSNMNLFHYRNGGIACIVITQHLMNRIRQIVINPIHSACLSDSDSGVSVCAPIKVLRMKSRSAHGPPAATDIIKKFSANPKPAHGPVKADHTVIASIKSQAVNGENKPKKDSSFTSCSINSNEKNQQWSRTPRVRFEDESEQEAESRYHDRCLLQKEDTGTIDTKSLNSHSTQSLESNKLDLRSKSPSPTPRETSQTISQQTINVPYRRQPFPPGVAKKVLIDIPRSGYTIRRSLYTEIAPVGTNITNKHVPQSLCKETTSLDGINLNVSRTNEEWKGQDLNISTSNNGVITQQGVSQTKSIERGITEVSSQVTVMRMKWGGSESSVSSQQSDSSSTLNLRPEPQPTGGELPSNLQKGAEISFYSKVKRSLHVRMKASSDSPVLSGNDQSKTSNLKEICSRHVRSLGTDVEFHLPSRFQGKENDDPGTKSNTNGFTRTTKVAGLMSYSDSSTHHRPKDLTLTNMERESAERAIPHKAPLFSMKMMKTFLKKGREKNYMVHLPSPPPSQDTRQHIHRDLSSSKEKVNSRHEAAQPSGKMTARLISTQSDSSRVIELQCPQIGFQGLYLAKRNQNPDSADCSSNVNMLTNHCVTNYYVTNHCVTNYYVTNHCLTNYYVTNYYVTNHCVTNYYVTNHCVTNYYVTNYYATNNCVTNYYVTNYRVTNYCVTNYYVTNYCVTNHCVTN